MTSYRPTVADVDLDAIRANVRALGALVDPGVEQLAVVKANAYGHGDIEVAQAALDAGATWLGVALVEEGIALRRNGIGAPILLLAEPTPDAAKETVSNDLTASVYTPRFAQALSEAATAAGAKSRVHVCIDTGMTREGLPPDRAVDVVGEIARYAGLEIEGLWTHLAVADEEGNEFTHEQLERFREVCDVLAGEGITFRLKHAANSPAAISFPEARLDMVRLGIAMYGLHPAPWQRRLVDLKAAMRLVSEVTLIRRVPASSGISYGLTYAPERDANVVNIPIGYGDGYPRRLSNIGDVLIGDRRRRIAGRVTMDTIMADCADDEIDVGAEVVLIGTQGAEEITADEIAEKAGTINYEIVTQIGPRVPRRYIR